MSVFVCAVGGMRAAKEQALYFEDGRCVRQADTALLCPFRDEVCVSELLTHLWDELMPDRAFESSDL